MHQWFMPGLSAAVATTIGLLLTRPFLVRHALDAPNHRSSHVAPTPRGGGLGVLLGILAGLIAGPGQFPSHRGLFTFAIAITLFALLGFVDDLASLSVTVRLLGQVSLVTGCAATFWSGAMVYMPGLSGLTGLLLIVGIALAGVFYVNAANFMDGVNGISSLHGMVGGGYFSLVGLAASSSSLALCGLVVSVSFAAFMPWNTLRPGLFLGDIGSYLLGSSMWLMAVGALLLGINIVVVLAPLVIYSLDVVATLARRLLRRANVFAPHREHTYQEIQQLTGSHAAAALACTCGTLLCGGVGWLTGAGLPNVAGTTLLVAVGLTYLCIPRMLRRLSMTRADS